MQKVFTILLASLLIASIYVPQPADAQVPQKMSYQAVIRNNSNQLVINKQIGIRVSILQASATGAAVYVETHTPTTNANGLVSIEIGGGTVVSGTFSSINWASSTFFIKTETDPTGSSNYTITGTSQLLSVPYALHAKTAENGFSGNYNDLANKPSNATSATNGFMTSADKTKLDNIATGAETNVNADWSATSGDAQILNKPATLAGYGIADAASKAYVDILMKQLYAQGALKLMDIDGNTYRTIQIGTQIWMTENLRTTKYKDSTAIPLVTNDTEWKNLTTPGYCWYENNEATYKTTYGALYNWYTVNTAKLCPAGWHVPTGDEWTNLTTYLGGEEVAGGKLKETGTFHWKSPNDCATDEAGFSARPGGLRFSTSRFGNIGFDGFWHSTSEIYRGINTSECRTTKDSSAKGTGISVRCIKD